MGYTEEEKAYLRALGIQLRQIRESQELSQEELAFKCGLHRTYIGGVERGERNISALKLQRIATTLQVGISQCFELWETIDAERTVS